MKVKKSQRLLAEAAAEAKLAKDVALKADADGGRDMTDDERADFEKHFEAAKAKRDEATAAKADEDMLKQVGDLADFVGDPEEHKDLLEQLADGGDDRRSDDAKRKAASLGLTVVSSAQFKALMKPYEEGEGRYKKIPDGTRIESGPIPVKSLLSKALITGVSDTSGGAFVVNDQSGIVEMLGRRTLSIRDAISVRRTTSDTVEYVQQTSRVQAAAFVAEATSSARPTAPGTAGALVNVAGGGYKPEGGFAFVRKTAVVKTVAEWVPATKRSLADVAQLEGLINDELRGDLLDKEEDQLVAGNGTGENLEGILTVSGTQAQAFDTNLFVTIRKALTKARIGGRVVPNAIGLNPVDLETIDLARTDSGGAGTGSFLGGGPFAAGPRTLWGKPIIESEGIPAGTGIVADWTKAVLWDREDATITMSDSHEDFFVRNLVAILAEQREAFAVTRPSAFVVADLTA